MKRCALIGTGSRGYCAYASVIGEYFSDCAQLVALLDVSQRRLDYVSARTGNTPTYTDFQKMVDETHPDCVIITTVDRFHDEYAVAALDRGIDVITEKPMAITAAKCKAVLDAEERNGRKISVIFNLRYVPQVMKIKQLMRAGYVGEVYNVDFEWMLDTSHGANYFRRWHRMMGNSGGLMVHKATHHFDLVNFLIEQDPVSIYAEGALNYYGKDRRPHAKRCIDCPSFSSCEYAYQQYDDALLQGLFFEDAKEGDYTPDGCIFDGEIDIYDSMNLVVRYNRGARMSYSLIAHSPYEGWKLNISGSNGRLEAFESRAIAQPHDTFSHIKIFDRDNDLVTVDVPEVGGGHGGGDMGIMNALLRGAADDPLNRHATSREGAMSALIGICANESIKTGRPIRLDEMIDTRHYFG